MITLPTDRGGVEVLRRVFGIEMRQYYCAAAGLLILGTNFFYPSLSPSNPYSILKAAVPFLPFYLP